MSQYASILSFLRVLRSGKWLRGANGSIPAALTATQMALLFVMAVFMAVLSTTPEMLTATVISLADEGSKMTEIPSFTMLFFLSLLQSWYPPSGVAASLLVQFPAPFEANGLRKPGH